MGHPLRTRSRPVGPDPQRVNVHSPSDLPGAVHVHPLCAGECAEFNSCGAGHARCPPRRLARDGPGGTPRRDAPAGAPTRSQRPCAGRPRPLATAPAGRPPGSGRNSVGRTSRARRLLTALAPAGAVQEHQQPQEDDAVPHAQNIGQWPGNGDDVPEPEQVRMGQHGRVLKPTGAQTGSRSAVAAEGITPPLTVMASPLRKAPMPMTGTPGSRRLAHRNAPSITYVPMWITACGLAPTRGDRDQDRLNQDGHRSQPQPRTRSSARRRRLPPVSGTLTTQSAASRSRIMPPAPGFARAASRGRASNHG